MRQSRGHGRIKAETGEPIRRVAVLVPARQEGERVGPTLRSVLAAADGTEVDLWVVLDGADPEAQRVAQALGARVLTKEPPGPGKGAVLRFAAVKLADRLRQSDAVMVLDVGSFLAPGFFRHLAWPPGVVALQARLQGAGYGPGEAACLSERLAQEGWDVGKQASGWSVRLRGTGTLFKPQVFLALAAQLRTQIEDTEASLLLQAQGARAALLPTAVVVDQKPQTLQQASRQRARWLAGQLQLLWCHRGTLLRLILRRPLEGLAWGTALLSRPLSLSSPARFLAGAALAALAWRRNAPLFALWGAVVAGSAAGEAAWFLVRYPQALGSTLQLACAWLRAVLLLPRAFSRWLRGRGGKP